MTTASFLTEDSYLGNITEPLTLNRYNYCVSSYPNYQDPSGNVLVPAVIGAIVGGVTGFVLGTVGEVVNYATAKSNGQEYDLTRGLLNVGNSTVSGVVAGTVMGATMNPVLAGTAGGVTSGFLNSTTDAFYDTEHTTGEKALNIVEETLKGGVSGAVGGTIGGLGANGIASFGTTTLGNSTLGGILQSAAYVGLGAVSTTASGTTYRTLSGEETTLEDVQAEMMLGAVAVLVGTTVSYGVNKIFSPKSDNTSISQKMNDALEKSKTNDCDVEGQKTTPTVVDPTDSINGVGDDGVAESGSKPIGATYEGTIYRSVDSRYDPLEMSQYTINSNHRYTESGVPGLYFSSGEKIVKAELGNYDVFDFSNRTMYSYDVRLTNMLDVSNPSVRSQLGISLESIVGESYDVTHAIGRYAYSNGYNGIIAPSARADGGINIILFNAKGVK